MKWSLLVALLVVVVLDYPTARWPASPNVQPPTGTQSGGVFYGAYTFATKLTASAAQFTIAPIPML